MRQTAAESCFAPCAQPTVTDELVLRGNFQTLPIAIYGWALSTHTAPHVRDSPHAFHVIQAYDVCHHAIVQLL
jgi:hypothetical protein